VSHFNPGDDPAVEPPAGLPAAVRGMEQEAPVLSPEQEAAIMAAEGMDGLGSADPTRAASSPEAHGENVAAMLDDSTLASIAQEVLEGVEADIDSNADMFDAFEKGVKQLGLSIETVDNPFLGASGAVASLLLEAVVRFVSTAHAELLPAAGPVRTQTGGEPQVEAAGKRKAYWLNYFLTTVDEGYYADCDAALLALALYGSVFRKVYRDPVSGQPRSRHLTPFQLLVSFHAPDLGSAQRVTHIEQLSSVEVRRRIVSGYYRPVPLLDGEQQDVPADRFGRRLEGRAPSGLQGDAEHTHYHSHCWLDVPGFQHAGDDGEPTGMRLPWVATVDTVSREVLRLEPDWDPADPLFRRREHYAHSLFHPGLGFYGWGLILLVGATNATASTLLRQAVNAFTLSSFPGGFRVKSARPERSQVSVGPNEFHELDTGGLPIQQAIMPLPYRDVPASFAPLLGAVVEAGQRLGQTVAMQVGEGRQDAPVGTTLALIEQAVRPTAAVLQRLHVAQRKEFRLLAAKFAEAAGEVYPYLVNGKPGQAMAEDFANAADIVPVSDPNVPTHMQRMGVAQAKLQLAMGSGGIMDVRAAHEGMLRTMGADDAEVQRLMPPPAQGEPMDVVSEFAMALKGMPLAVGPAQMHEAHLRAHIGQMQMPNLPPNVVQALLAHAGDHLAWAYRLQAQQALGMEIPAGQPMPPELEAAIAMGVAQASEGILAAIAPALGGAGADQAAMAKAQIEAKKLEFSVADAARKAEETARQDATEVLKVRSAAEQAAADRELKREEMAVDLRLEAMKALAAARRPQPVPSGPGGGVPRGIR
jgi:hypothetical protein